MGKKLARGGSRGTRKTFNYTWYWNTPVVTRLSPGLSGSFGDTVRDTKEYKGLRAVGSILLDLLLALLYRLEFHLKISFHV